MALQITRTLSLDDIVPYWRNPRVITDESVNAVAESISRYGYQQPIVVDSDNVIIIGHTRYAALRRLGVTEAPVAAPEGLSPSQVKKLRVLDNRTQEYTSWDFDELVQELGEMDDNLMRPYFPEVVPEAEDGPDLPDDGEFSLAGADVQDSEVEFVCPSCFHNWQMNVTREAVLSGRIEVQR